MFTSLLNYYKLKLIYKLKAEFERPPHENRNFLNLDIW